MTRVEPAREATCLLQRAAAMGCWGMRSRVLALVACVGCSFVGVHGPAVDPQASSATCTQSDLLPSIDAVVGTIGVAGALGGELADHLSGHPMHNFELIVALPALVAGIAFLTSASHGTDRVEACRALREGPQRGCDGCEPAVP